MQNANKVYTLDNTEAEDLDEEILETVDEKQPEPEKAAPKQEKHFYGQPLPNVKYKNDYTMHKRVGMGFLAVLIATVVGGYFYIESNGVPRWVNVGDDDAFQQKSLMNADTSGTTADTVTTSVPKIDVGDEARAFIDETQAAAIVQASETIRDPGALAVKAGLLTKQLLLEADAPHDVAMAAALETTDKLLREQGIDPRYAAGHMAHVNIAIQDQQIPSTQERTAYIAESVADAVASAGGNLDEQITASHKAIDYEAQETQLSQTIITEEKTRSWAIAEAKAKGLNKEEAARLGVLAVSKESEQLTTAFENTRLAPSDSVAPVANETLGAASYESSRTLRVADVSLPETTKANSYHSKTRTGNIEQVSIGNATAEADQKGLQGAERSEYITRRTAEIMAEGMGLSKLEIEVAGVRAAAYELALRRGHSDANAKNYADNEAIKYMQSKDVPQNMLVLINERVAGSVKLISGYESSLLSSTPQPAPVFSDARLEGRVNNLEQTLSTLSIQVTETNKLIVELAQTQLKAQKESQDQFKSINTKIGGMNEKISAIESKPDNNRFEAMMQKLDKRTEKLVKNYGWTSNRLCEAEAMSGNFVNENTCKAIYDKVRAEAKTKPATIAQSTPAVKVPVTDNQLAAVGGNVVSTVAPKRSVYPRTIARTDTTINSVMPATTSAGSIPEDYKLVLEKLAREREEKARAREESERLALEASLQKEIAISLPPTQPVVTQVSESAPAVTSTPVATAVTSRAPVAVSACSKASTSYKATMVSSNRAVIENRWGASKRLVSGSYIDGLGSVTRFVEDGERRIEFTNGVICSV